MKVNTSDLGLLGHIEWPSEETIEAWIMLNKAWESKVKMIQKFRDGIRDIVTDTAVSALTALVKNEKTEITERRDLVCRMLRMNNIPFDEYDRQFNKIMSNPDYSTSQLRNMVLTVEEGLSRVENQLAELGEFMKTTSDEEKRERL